MRLARIGDRPVLLVDDTEETSYDGYRIVYLRHGTEHHSIVLADRPDAVDTQPETYVGPAFLGPVG